MTASPARSADPQSAGPRRPFKRAVAGTLIAMAVSVTFLAACGDDDSGDDEVSSEEAFCNAGDDLRTDVDSLSEIDLVGEGTDGIQTRLDAINDDIEALKSSGSDVAADEITALSTAEDDLESALGDAGDEITVDNVTAVATAVTNLVNAATDVYTVLDTTCS